MCIAIMTATAQTQIGQDIDGENQGDRSGRSVSLSSDGTIVAVGANRNGNNNNSTIGHVRVYENINNTWIQIGEDIDGEDTGDESGASISLNNEGTIVAIGARLEGTNDTGEVRVFENINESWVQVGQDINGEDLFDLFGAFVDLNASGTILAVGATNASNDNGTRTGHVRVFENVNDTWTQIGQDIDGEDTNDTSGVVSLNDSGTIIAIGAPANDSNGSSSGHVRIYENIDNTWTQIGQDIDGESAGDNSGFSIDMSSDGTNIAIGSPTGNDPNGIGSGHVRVFENVNNTWTQIGQNIDGEESDGQYGSSVSLSDDGTILAIGARFNDGINGINSGQVEIFKRQNNNWVQVGNTIEGEAESNLFGGAVSLSSIGNTVAIGATFNDGVNGIDSGHTRVFDLSSVLNISDITSNKNNIVIYPNPTYDSFSIENSAHSFIKEITVIDIDGRVLESQKITDNRTDIQIDLKKYSSGIYFIHIQTKESFIVKRIIKQ